MRAPKSIGRRVVLATLGATVAATTMSIAVGAWQVSNLTDRAVEEQTASVMAQTAERTSAVHDLVVAQASAVQNKVDSDLEVARHVMQETGPVSGGDQSVTWTAINQFTQEEAEVSLPQLLVGGTWLGQNTDPSVETPVVDEVRDLVGGTTTIFQRMNEEGDMLRVATNVQRLDGNRAVGTFIPATNPDGAANPVIASVLAGETYRGIAYVVNAWYVTAYEPILDASGEVVGILYVGVPQENITEMRTAIEGTVLGETGSISIVNTGGANAGSVIMSGTHPDGTLLEESVAAEQAGWLEALTATAVAAPGEVVQGETLTTADGPLVTTAVFHQPWDWAIIGLVPEADLQAGVIAVRDSGRDLMQNLLISGLLVLLAGAALAAVVSRSIARSVREQAEATGEAARSIGDATRLLGRQVGSTVTQAETTSTRSGEVSGSVQAVAATVEELNASFAETARSAEQVTAVADEAVLVVDEAAQTISRLGDSSAEIGKVVEMITSIAEQTNLLALNATIEAARAGEAGRGFAVVASEVQDLARETAKATEEIATRIQSIQGEAHEAVGGIDRVKGIIATIADLQTTTAGAVQEQTATTAEIARAIGLAAGSTTVITDSATMLAGTSRDARGALDGAERALTQLRDVVTGLMELAGSDVPAGGARDATAGGPPPGGPAARRPSRAARARQLGARDAEVRS